MSRQTYTFMLMVFPNGGLVSFFLLICDIFSVEMSEFD